MDGYDFTRLDSMPSVPHAAVSARGMRDVFIQRPSERMHGDQLSEGERCASTSNRTFEGRQGLGGRTHLVSPAMAAAAALAGHCVDLRAILEGLLAS
jgi:hypothetical protein